jgi:ligand-binding sensor domain-containing protein
MNCNRNKNIVFSFDEIQTALVRLILLFVFSVLLQLLAPAQQAREYSFKHFSVSSGLASNTVNAITQDAEGYIWIATTNGLQRYDGNNFISFKAQGGSPSAIPSSQIMGLYKDGEHNLWVIADNNRIGIFDTRKFLFKEAKIAPEALKMYVPQRLMNLPTGELVLHKENGKIYQYNAAKNEFVPAAQLFPLPKNWKCTHIS